MRRFTLLLRATIWVWLSIVVLAGCSTAPNQAPSYRFQIVDAQQKPILAANVSLRWSDEPTPFSVSRTDNQGFVGGMVIVQGAPENWSRELVVIATESTFDYDTDLMRDRSTTLTVTLQHSKQLEQTITIDSD
ncbi:hypothetical protein [Herpetosiphon geysericola]|uniref:Uncharacterized protein n=1 Tax=Herpetosiphon geysericola TaxID=70996 RepID=A0A0P6XSM1_9CHLR|nr:hypothetical protein [Herpetosiphon geysericola]KPL83363.1 hypothetical protein SE18_19315 [Herpetosiphon geysericola]